MVTVRVEIKYLKGVEDPEAVTIQKNLNVLGYKTIKSVKSVKVYDLEISENEKDPIATAKELAERLLVNPVIHQYDIKELSE